MKIVFISFIDSKNIGDQLIVNVLEEKLMKSHEVVKFSFNLTPEKKISGFQKDVNNANHYKLLLKKTYNDYIRNLKFIDWLHLIKMKNNIDNNRYLDMFKKEVKNCDLLIIGGGNAIFDLTRYSLSAYKFNKILSIANNYNKKTFVTSIGIGPFKTQKQVEYTIETLDKADYITVRDKKSFNYIKAALYEKAHLSIDPVFLLNRLIDDRQVKFDRNGKKVISICIIDLLLNKDSSKKYKEYVSNFVELINLLSKENYIINLFSTEPRDYRAVNDVYSLLNNYNNINLIIINDFEDLIKLYTSTDLVIGTRMHSMIIALSQFIPVIGLSWQDKVKEMFEMVGLTEDVFDISDFNESIPKIFKLVSEKLNNEDNNNLVKMKYKNNEIFEENINLINKLIREIAKEQKGNINGN